MVTRTGCDRATALGFAKLRVAGGDGASAAASPPSAPSDRPTPSGDRGSSGLPSPSAAAATSTSSRPRPSRSRRGRPCSSSSSSTLAPFAWLVSSTLHQGLPPGHCGQPSSSASCMSGPRCSTSLTAATAGATHHAGERGQSPKSAGHPGGCGAMGRANNWSQTRSTNTSPPVVAGSGTRTTWPSSSASVTTFSDMKIWWTTPAIARSAAMVPNTGLPVCPSKMPPAAAESGKVSSPRARSSQAPAARPCGSWEPSRPPCRPATNLREA
mmetsp:Transcript_23603/g.67486  ORF Transcript_23603/g.67486 Transcript_23603/m.67486 type:complete len:269 (-) Transcript_23603:390-1196(-)